MLVGRRCWLQAISGRITTPLGYSQNYSRGGHVVNTEHGSTDGLRPVALEDLDQALELGPVAPQENHSIQRGHPRLHEYVARKSDRVSVLSGIQVRTPRPRNELFATPSTRLTGRCPRRNWAHDRLADVAVDDINYTTRSNVNVGQIQAIAASKIGA